MLKVAITGGIGSGKTTVLQLFAALGIPIYHADQRAKELMLTDPIKNQLIQEFGSEIYSVEGQLINSKLSSLVFNAPERLKRLNQIVHPAVAKDYENWHQAQKSPYTLKEAAIIFEIGGEASYDKIILVVAPVDVRISRVQHRSGLSVEEIEARIKNQWPDEKKIPMADFVISNFDLKNTENEVIAIHQKLLQLSEIQSNN